MGHAYGLKTVPIQRRELRGAILKKYEKQQL
jgi:hypothetical protein